MKNILGHAIDFAPRKANTLAQQVLLFIGMQNTCEYNNNKIYEWIYANAYT